MAILMSSKRAAVTSSSSAAGSPARFREKAAAKYSWVTASSTPAAYRKLVTNSALSANGVALNAPGVYGATVSRPSMTKFSVCHFALIS